MKKLLAALLAAVATYAFAGPACPQFSPNGQPPVLTNAKLAAKTKALCYSDFEVLHSGVTHGPLWSAEHLTRAHLSAAKGEVRTNKFYEEPALPQGEGARLADYRNSSNNRGHNNPPHNPCNNAHMAQSAPLA